MKAIDLLKEVSFSDVIKELLITNPKFQEKLTEFFVFFQNLKQASTEGMFEGVLTIDRDSFDRCYIKSSKQSGDSFFIATGDYLNAVVGEWETEHVSPALLVAALLVSLTEEGVCFTESDRMEFSKKLFWHSYSFRVDIRLAEEIG